MKLAAILVTVLLAVTVQAALARYTVGGQWVFDLVLVGVVFAALQWGPVAGMVSGTLGGLLQDLLAGGVVGVGGLAKTCVGFAAGTIGTQFVLAKPGVRTAVAGVATVVHRVMILAMMALIEQQWPAVSWRALLAEVALNAIAALIVFQMGEALPGAVERGRMGRRSSLSRRQW